jgi:hypothetical protein
MATFAVDIHGVRMNELAMTARAKNTPGQGTFWITLEFGTRDTITLFFATEADFLEMRERLCPTPSEETPSTPLGEEIPF